MLQEEIDNLQNTLNHLNEMNQRSDRPDKDTIEMIATVQRRLLDLKEALEDLIKLKEFAQDMIMVAKSTKIMSHAVKYRLIDENGDYTKRLIGEVK